MRWIINRILWPRCWLTWQGKLWWTEQMAVSFQVPFERGCYFSGIKIKYKHVNLPTITVFHTRQMKYLGFALNDWRMTDRPNPVIHFERSSFWRIRSEDEPDETQRIFFVVFFAARDLNMPSLLFHLGALQRRLCPNKRSYWNTGLDNALDNPRGAEKSQHIIKYHLEQSAALLRGLQEALSARFTPS